MKDEKERCENLYAIVKKHCEENEVAPSDCVKAMHQIVTSICLCNNIPEEDFEEMFDSVKNTYKILRERA